MWGVTSDTIPPSVRKTSRSTPCVLGCCGPMFTSISSVRTSNSMIRGSSSCEAIYRYPARCGALNAFRRRSFAERAFHQPVELFPGEMPFLLGLGRKPANAPPAQRQPAQNAAVRPDLDHQVLVHNLEFGGF